MTLNESEIGAIIKTIGLTPKLDASEVVSGVESLRARGLLIGDNDDLRPSERLGATLAPVLLPEEFLVLLKVGATANTELYFCRKGVYATSAVDKSGMEVVRVFDNTRLRVAAASFLTDTNRIGVPLTDVPDAFGALRSILDGREHSAGPSLKSVSIIRRQKAGGDFRQAVVFVHEDGYTWLEQSLRTILASAETDDDLSELVGDFLADPVC